MRRFRQRLRDDRGFAAAELVILTPVLALALMFVVAAGRLGSVQAEISAATRDAARAASQQANDVNALAAAIDTASASLVDRHVICGNLDVTLGPETDFVSGGRVSVYLTCDVQLADLAVPGLPGVRTVGANSVEVVDSFRWVE